MIVRSLMTRASLATHVFVLCSLTSFSHAQNYERYKPRDISRPNQVAPKLPAEADLPPKVEDDRVLVDSLEAVVIVDNADKLVKTTEIDSLEGIHYDFESTDSLVYESTMRSIVQRHLGQPITLRRLNQLTREMIQKYRECKQPIVDVLIPEQRITGGTLHVVVIESRVGKLLFKPGCYFDSASTSRWIQCTLPGKRIYEPDLENDLFWLNQNPFCRVGVDFRKGTNPGTTDVIFDVDDIFPMRGYVGIDDSGVETLNFGRIFGGFQYGNFLGRGGMLGYQYTADEDFSLLEAHSASLTQPINRDYTFQAYGSWASVAPQLNLGLTQDGESWQVGSGLTRHLVRNRYMSRNLSIGIDFKSTNNNLEFAGSNISTSNADLLQLRVGFDESHRHNLDEYSFFSANAYIGPGGGFTGANSTAAFNSIRPGTSPDYIYGRLTYERADLFRKRWLVTSRFTGQASSERILFSETLGLGGFDTIRGLDQRAFNADHGWMANVEFGPCTYRFGNASDPRTLRTYAFIDLGNGYLDQPQAGEDASTFVISTGIGARLQISDSLTARFDYGIGLKDDSAIGRNDRAHFGLTWIPGRRM